MEPDYVMTEVSLFAEAPAAGLTNARLEASVNPLVSMYTKYPIEGFVAITALELVGRNLLDFAQRCHLGHLANERMIIVYVLDCIYGFQIQWCMKMCAVVVVVVVWTVVV